jgi:hypothetical protein
MILRVTMILGVTTILGATVCAALVSSAEADASLKKPRHHRHPPVVRQADWGFREGGRLVNHPAFSIACQTRDRATRALPCDQPVWVYGRPCEIDLGLGRWRDCD